MATFYGRVFEALPQVYRRLQVRKWIGHLANYFDCLKRKLGNISNMPSSKGKFLSPDFGKRLVFNRKFFTNDTCDQATIGDVKSQWKPHIK